jgi:hypothetical protein
MTPSEKAIEENLMCPICLDFMTNPTTVICGHNFCWDCIIMNNINCAVCRRKFSHNQITVNYQLKEVISSYKSLKMDIEQMKIQYQQQVQQRVTPVFFNTYNIFNNSNNNKWSFTVERNTNNPLILKNRGNKMKRKRIEWSKEDINNLNSYPSSDQINVNSHIPNNYQSLDNIYNRIDIMMEDYELMAHNFSDQNMISTSNGSTNNERNNTITDDSCININYLNNVGKRFKYK